jgi:hypothetical protein
MLRSATPSLFDRCAAQQFNSLNDANLEADAVMWYSMINQWAWEAIKWVILRNISEGCSLSVRGMCPLLRSRGKLGSTAPASTSFAIGSGTFH